MLLLVLVVDVYCTLMLMAEEDSQTAAAEAAGALHLVLHVLFLYACMMAEQGKRGSSTICLVKANITLPLGEIERARALFALVLDV